MKRATAVKSISTTTTAKAIGHLSALPSSPSSSGAGFTLPCLINLASRDITERAPWSSPDSNCPQKLEKSAVRNWQNDPGTSHLFYSAYEGDNPTSRMSKENPPRLLRAVVVDYDCYSLSEDTLQGALDDVSPEMAPSFISRSHSGGVHAIWLLEESIWVASPDLRKRLLDWLKKHLRLSQLLPSLDDKAFHDAMIYHHAGRDWQGCGGKPIAKVTIARALAEVGERASFRGAGVKVPLERVAEEVEARWPGRWQGDFVENARGVRFWEPDADALSAIVKPEGMLCYTGETGFRDWASIFGHGFVEKYLDDKIGGAADCAWFDGKDFWTHSETLNAWTIIQREDLARKLKVEFGLSGMVGKGETASEVDRAIHHIASIRRVSSAAPFVQRMPGILYVGGKQHLNTSCVKACAPMDGECIPEDFPWIANFLDNHFSETKDGHDPKEQLFRFLAWMKRAYQAGLNYSPAQGQVLILAGEVGSGKTLLSNVLIADALGGSSGAENYLLGESRFNKGLYQVPCWTVDDATVASDPHRKTRYNSLVKKVAANQSFEMEAKFRDAVDVSWQGRLVITCNVDPESIQVMPSLDMSMSDKILALRVWGDNSDDSDTVEKVKWFGEWNGRKPAENIRHELPCFLAWLLCWEVPEWIKLDPRFGFKSYHHPELKAHADSVSASASFEEVLRMFLTKHFESNPEQLEWKGTATRLLQTIQDEYSPVKAVAKEYNSRNLGRNLAGMVSRKKCGKVLGKNGNPIYQFNRDDWRE